MTTSIGQCAPVFLPGEPQYLTEKPGRPQSTGSQKVGHYRSDPVSIDARIFLPVAALPPVRIEGEGSIAAWVIGVLAALGTQGGWRLGQQEI